MIDALLLYTIGLIVGVTIRDITSDKDLNTKEKIVGTFLVIAITLLFVVAGAIQ